MLQTGAAIVDYLSRIATRELVEPLPQRLGIYLSAANYLENIGDIIETDLVESARKRRAA